MVNQPKRPNPEWTIAKLLAWVTDYFKTHRIDSPRSTAEILLAHALNQPRIGLYMQFDKPLNNDELAGFKTLMKRRLNHEPVAYIVGTKGFWTLDLAVSADVLIPRPETECLVETALALLPDHRHSGGGDAPKRVLDLGTGSGAVVLSLASERPENDYYASDISVPAIQVARNNAAGSGLDGKVRFLAGNWFQPLSPDGPPFHLIVSNPPYIRSPDIGGLQPEIHEFEPKIALDGNVDGLGCLSRIIRGATAYLMRQGYLILEIGYDQKDDVRRLAESSGDYEKIKFFKDYNGLNRVVCMRKKG